MSNDWTRRLTGYSSIDVGLVPPFYSLMPVCSTGPIGSRAASWHAIEPMRECEGCGAPPEPRATCSYCGRHR